MVLKVYGFRSSLYTHLVALIAKELGVKYELVNVDLTKDEQSRPEYKVYQPFGKVPCIVSRMVLSKCITVY